VDRWLGAALDYLPGWIDYQVRQAEQPGCLLAIAHAGKVVLEHAAGAANLATAEKLTPRHRFRIASHSKAFTAAGILKLREQKKLGLDDPVGRYVDGLHPRVAETRLAQLLSHSAGLTRDGPDSGWYLGRMPYPDRAGLMELLSAPPMIEPGLRLKYSNPGFALLGLVIESVTGERYRKWIEREIVAEAGLRETQADAPLKRGTRFARGHTSTIPLGRRLVLRGDEKLNALAPAGGFVATAGDTALFYNQLAPAARPSVLSPASRREMGRRLWRNPSSIESYYGYGLQSGTLAGWNFIGHGGGLFGYVSRTVTLLEIGVTISIMSNAGDGWAGLWVEGAANTLRALATHGAPARSVRSWAGRWWSEWGPFDLVPAGNKVLIASPGFINPFLDHGVIELTGRDSGKVTVSAGYGIFGEPAHRLRNKAGRVVEMRLGSGRSVSEARAIASLLRYHGPGHGPGRRHR